MLLAACENDLNKVKQISAMEINKPVDSTTGVDIVYSDSARVKAHVITPLMLNHTVANPYYEMPKGVKIVFFDSKMSDKGASPDPAKHIVTTVTSDYAITSNNNRIIKLQKHVVVNNVAGDVFTSEVLYWDADKKLIYTDQPCTMTKADGSILNGTSFKSNDSFTNYSLKDGRGDIKTQGNLLQ
jgi:hypothetical protein